MTELATFDSSLPINPSSAQVDRFLALDTSLPVVFVNLHEYHESARYPETYRGIESTAVTGREAYHRYLSRVEKDYLPQVGARFLIVAPCALVMIGEGNWAEAVIGCYPSRAAAMHLPALPGYADLQVHRVAGLKKALTVALTEAALARLPPAVSTGS
jgi:uncharacterized protein (DUF1330 family)